MIEVKNVSKKYRKVKALDDISFNIEEGKITCILGINGVGKSTILKSIAGLIKPDKGEILIDNEKLTYKTYNKISFVPDVDNHFAQYTIKESFEFMKQFYKNWDDEKAYEMLELFNLTDDRKISKLSKGNYGSLMGVLNSSKAIGQVTGSLLAGFIFDLGNKLPFLISALIILIAFIIMLPMNSNVTESNIV